MKFVRFSLLALACVLAFQGCKKDEEETKKYLTGTMVLDTKMPQYVFAGRKYDFVPSGITASDGTHIAYYFTSPKTSVKDTIMSSKYPATKFTYTVPDTLATLTLSCTAYAEGSEDYYTTTGSVTFSIVDSTLNKGTLTGFNYYAKDEKAKLYGDDYYVTKLNGTYWMRQNLAYIVGDEEKGWSFGHPYYESDAMRRIFGSYYTWEEAQTACPAGWRLPSEQDWVNILKMAGAQSDIQPLQEADHGAGRIMDWCYFNKEKMWEYYRNVDITNSLYLSVLPIGYALVQDGTYTYSGYGDYAMFWTSDEVDGKGVYRYVYKDSDKVFVERASKTDFALPVRCVK